MKSGFVFLGLIVLLAVGFVIAEDNSTNQTGNNETNQTNSTGNNSTNVTITCTVDSNCSTGYECEDNQCVLKNETEHEDNETNETDHEAKTILKDNFGARVRMLQLERSIYRMTLQAQAVIDVIKAKNSSINTTTLENQLAEMNVLFNQTKAILDQNLTNSSNSTVKQFVSIKEDAIRLRKAFRDEARKYLTSDDKKAIRERFNDIDKQKLKDFNDQIRDQIKEYNGKRLHELSLISGLKDISEKIKKGEMNTDEAIREMKKEYIEKQKEERDRIKESIRETAKQEIEHINEISKARQESVREIAKRAQERTKEINKEREDGSD